MRVRSTALHVLALSCAAVITLAAQSTPSNTDWCADAGDRDRETFCEVREMTMARPGVLDVSDNPNGSISVTASNRSDVLVRARVVATAERQADADALGKEVRITVDGGRVRATGPRTDWRERRGWHVSYRIEVPASQDLELESSNGSITVTGVSGRQRMTTSNGSLRLTDVSGDVVASTSNGSAHVALGGTTWNGAGLELRTSNGSVRLDVPEKYNARLVAGTSNGSLSVDMPITVQGRISREVDATLGSGGPTLRVQSANGSVRIGRR